MLHNGPIYKFQNKWKMAQPGRGVYGLTGLDRHYIKIGNSILSPIRELLVGDLPLEVRRRQLRIANWVITKVQAQLLVQNNLPERNFDGPKKTIDTLNPLNVSAEYKFNNQAQLRELVIGFQLPNNFKLKNGASIPSEECLLLFLYKTKHSMTFRQLEGIFHRDYTTLGRMYTHFARWMKRHWGYLHTDNFAYWVPQFPIFARAIHRQMVRFNDGVDPLPPGQEPDIFGFPDGHNIATNTAGAGPAAPGPDAPRRDPDGQLQEATYNGWLHQHGVKLLTVALPNGMSLFVSKLYSMRRNDLHLLHDTDLNQKVHNAQLAYGQHRLLYRMYGDGIFPWMSCLRSKFRAILGGVLTPFETLFNTLRNKVRISVEWSYRDVICFFGGLEEPSKMRMMQSDIQAFTTTVWLLMDAYNTMNMVQRAQFFELQPPTLREWTSQGPR